MEPARSAIAWPRERMVWMASSARPPNASATMGMHSTPASRQAGRLEASLRCTPTWRAWPGVTEASGRVCCWRGLTTRARKYGKPHVRANTEKMRDCHLVARTCDNEVGVAISIRDPYTSPFTSRCKFARCLLLVRCLCSETVAIGFLSSVEPNFVERTALGSLKRRRSYSR